MDDSLKSFFNLFGAPANLLPGFILLFVRSRFTAGARLPSLRENAGLYLVFSAIYLILFGPILTLAVRIKPMFEDYLANLAAYLILPTLLGVLLGITAQRHSVRNLFLKSTAALKISVNLADPTPTAWDWKFAQLRESFVIIKFKNDSTVYGWAGPNSFFSSDPAERDLFIERVYILDEHGRWQAKNLEGIWIDAGEISTIEFIRG